MNITMIVPYFEPEVTAIVHLMSDLAYDFAEYGAKVTVITGFPLKGTSESIRREYFDKKEEQITDNLNVIRIGSKKEEGKNFFIRGLKYIIKTYALYRKARSVPTDVYYIYSTPPIMGLAGAALSRKAPTVYSLQDIFPDNLLAKVKLTDGSVIAKFLKILEAYIYRHNTHIVTISRDMSNNLIKKKVDVKKITVLGNWIDTNEIIYVPRETNFLFEQFNLDKNKFYVSYSGNLGFAQDINIILESAKIMQRIEPKINYIIIGNGIYEDEIKQQIINEDINNVMVFPLQPEKNSAYVYSLGDIGLVTLKEDLHEYAMPSKIWSMMAASQPIICTAVENSQLYEILDQTNVGATVKPGDCYNLTNEIISLYNNQDKLKIYGANGRTYVENNLTRAETTVKYYDLMKFVVAERKKL